MKRTAKILLYIQLVLGHLMVFLLGSLTFFLVRMIGYRVKDLRKIREDVRKLFEEHQGPWVICPNHLTMIDSVVLAYAIAPLHRYLLNYRMLPWNLPESANFQSNIVLAAFCYLTKCIPISRGGDRKKMKATMEKCSYLLKHKENLLIFPEGGRSRTGRVDTKNFSYGVGRLINNNPDCHVLCVYLRGDGQETYSNIPRIGERFTVRIETFQPLTEDKGLKGQRECARQIIEYLALMEKDYFDRKRYRRSHRFPGDREESGYAVHEQSVHTG